MNFNTTPNDNQESAQNNLKYKIAYEILAEAAVSEWEISLGAELSDELRTEISAITRANIGRGEIDTNLHLELRKQTPTYQRITQIIRAANALLKMHSYAKVDAMSISELEEKVSFEDQAASAVRAMPSPEGNAAFGRSRTLLLLAAEKKSG